MKVDRALLNDIEDKLPQEFERNPKKFYPGLFDRNEAEFICDRINSDRELIGDNRRIFPRRVGDGTTARYIEAEPELPVEVINEDGFEEIDPASSIMESGPHLFELHVVHTTKMDLDQEKLFAYCAEGFYDIFEDTYVEDVFEAGL
jgi:hypothetical protein